MPFEGTPKTPFVAPPPEAGAGIVTAAPFVGVMVIEPSGFETAVVGFCEFATMNVFGDGFVTVMPASAPICIGATGTVAVLPAVSVIVTAPLLTAEIVVGLVIRLVVTPSTTRFATPFETTLIVPATSPGIVIAAGQ
jgi:hypothetical protein